MKEIDVSQRVKDRLLAVFSHPAWQEGEDGELFAGNENRRIEYQNNPEEERMAVSLLVSHEEGGWDVVLELVLREDGVGGTQCTLSVGLAWEEGRKGWGEERFYGVDGVRGYGIGRLHFGEEFGMTSRHREEMLLSEANCPSRIDMEKTVELFLDQVAGLRLERPVLIPVEDEG